MHQFSSASHFLQLLQNFVNISLFGVGEPTGLPRRRLDPPEDQRNMTDPMEVQNAAKVESSPMRKRGIPEEPLSLDAIRDVVRGEIQGAVAGMSDRVAALEKNLQQHNDRTFQAVETLSTGQADQGLRIAELASDSKLLAGRLSQLEGTVKNLQSSGSTPSTVDAGRVPALVMGGWSPDSPAGEVLQKANEMARDLQLQLNMSDAFVPGVRRGFVLIPLSPNDGESEEGMRQRAQACIRRVNSSNISLGRNPMEILRNYGLR